MKTIAQNKKSYFNYEILLKFESGIKLVGSEMKSIRDGKVSINEAYCYINNGEVFIKGMYIKEWDMARDNHEPYRERKLLLNRQEITKINKKIEEKGMALIPIKLYLKYGRVKLEIGVGKGKKTYDKRNDIRKKDDEINKKRELKDNI